MIGPGVSPSSSRGIWQIGIVLLAIHAVIALINLTPLIDGYYVASLLDVNAEGTVHVWLSSTQLTVVAALFAVGAWISYRSGEERRATAAWVVISAGFVLLSIDETAGLHELVGEKASGFLEIEALPSLYTWVVVVAPVAAVAAVWLIRWFGRSFGFRTLQGRLAVVAVALWMMVPLFEALDPSLGGPRLLVVIEESFEMVGETLAIVALLLHFERQGHRLRSFIS